MRTPPEPLPIEPYFRRLPGSEPFLYAIACDPDDDQLRLVFADWLEENGEPARAEFIRKQCRHDSTYDLERAHRERWREGLTHLSLRFERGLLESLDIRFFASLSEEDQEQLDIRHLLLRNGGNELREWLTCPRLRQIHALDASWLTPATLEVLADCPHLGNVRHLDLALSVELDPVALLRLPCFPRLLGLRLTAHGGVGARVAALLQAPQFPRLRALRVNGRQLGDAVAVAVAACPQLADLEWLDLSYTEMRATGGRAIARSPVLRNLRHLDLRSNQLGTVAEQALADAAAFPKIRFLAFGSRVIETQGSLGLSRVQHWIEMASKRPQSELNLADGSVTAEALRTLLAAPAFAAVTQIDLSGALVKPTALDFLAASPHLAHVAHLNLSGNKLKSIHLDALLHSPHTAGLRELDVSNNRLGLAGVRAVLTAPGLAHVGRVRVADNLPLARLIEHSPSHAGRTGSPTPGVLELLGPRDCENDDAARTLATAPELATIHTVRMTCRRLTDEGAIALVSSPFLTGLRELVMIQCQQLTVEVWRALAKAVVPANATIRLTHVRGSAKYRPLLQKRWPSAIVLTYSK